jgi:probable rRNA maturation factor
MVNVLITADSRYSVNKLAIQSTINEVLKKNGVLSNVEISVSVVGDRKMHEINKKYRGYDKTTNILTFALEDPAPQSQLQVIPRIGFVKSPDNILRLGDIILSYPQIVKEASMDGISIEDELVFLVEHGTKHLLGIHHE